MIYVVLGMHKSGTTLLSQILHFSGIDMGDFAVDASYDAGDKYERQECLRLNLELLGTTDFDVLDLEAPRAAAPTAAQTEHMQDIVRICNGAHAAWGFKDPRTCLTYGHWQQALPEHRIIAVYRDPAQIWPRFKWLGKRKYHTNFHRASRYLQRWHEHNLGILTVLEQTQLPYLVLSYHDLMTQPEMLGVVEDFVGRPLQDRRVPEMYRSRKGGDLFLALADRWLRWRHGLSVAGTLARMAALAPAVPASATRKLP